MKTMLSTGLPGTTLLVLGFIAALLLTFPQLAAQDASAVPSKTAADSETSSKIASAARPREFRSIELGMSRAEVQSLLAADDLFFYRGDPDVSLLPRREEVLLEVSGQEYIKRAFFQFFEDQLFIMIFSMNERKIDHYSIFTSLSVKYGKPDSLSPAESVWEDEQTRVSLERPLAVKYIDRTIFEQLRNEATALENFSEILRKDFLDDF